MSTTKTLVLSAIVAAATGQALPANANTASPPATVPQSVTSLCPHLKTANLSFELAPTEVPTELESEVIFVCG